MHNIEIGILENTIDCENEPCADGSNGDDEEVSETTEFDVEYDEGVTRSEEWLQVHTAKFYQIIFIETHDRQ